MKLVRGLKHFDCEEYTLFSLPRSASQPYINFNTNFSLKEILAISEIISKEQKEPVSRLLLNLVQDICSKNFTIKNGQDKLLEAIYSVYANYKGVEVLESESEKP